ncbi:asparaginyl-tRNA synthetase [Monoraphidium neglectum]|uniref:Asparaginyl-tRNA synthetase n=1 Tax=Monoraphidium neglectum TaxID=145388 RepID=A0A0D2JLY1_9CHLO|nr:asparaginyl-tRNA synthetase [Monoraphidium neglectum]KIZ00208.1 asparaginyl-tRNA synthetase [Monoraphidium neglectum]|eukprot:XP_013899227.1 asparaginyl-tRNA synthetase [Monoraphidium neglectum]
MAAPAATQHAELEELRQKIAALQADLREKEANSELVHPYSQSYGRAMISSILGTSDGGKSLAGTKLRVGGWVKTGREAGAGAFAFLEVNDGSSFDSLQVMVTKEVAEEVGGLKRLAPTGTAVLVEGELAETPEGTKQAVELKATKVLHVGACDAATYPMAKKKQTLEFLREKAHLRPRRVHREHDGEGFGRRPQAWNGRGFYYVHTPIITASDCEGAGEMFAVTTLFGKEQELRALPPPPSKAELEDLRGRVAAQAERVKEAKGAAAADKGDASKAAASKAEVDALLALKKELEAAEAAALYQGGFRRTPQGDLDYKDDFFSRAAFLTVSGQLQGEAENSNTTRHLAEFWMIEPEIAFCDLQDNMRCAEDYVRFCCRWVLDHCEADLAFITKMYDKGAKERLEQVAGSSFARCSYTEAIEKLEEAIKGGRKFDNPVSWGIDLATEHERYLAEELFKGPAFYMKVNEDGRTVAAMDVLVPKVGELIGGSQREDRYDVLVERIQETGMPVEAYEAYLDLRKYGTVPHSGFGLGFERLILFSTGLENIRDVIPFPRVPGSAAF